MRCRDIARGTPRALAPILLAMLPWIARPAEAQTKEASQEDAQAALAEFSKYYANPNEHVRKAAVMGLGECNHGLAVTALIQALSDPSPAVREAGEEALAKQTSRASLLRLRDTLGRSRQTTVRVAILRAFRVSRPALAYGTVLELCEDRTLAVRLAATETLAELSPEDERTGDVLKELLSDKEALVRAAAVDAVARLELTSLADDCIEVLESDREWRVRAAAIAALGQLRVEAAIEPLIEVLAQEEGRLRDDAFTVLREITGEDNFLADAEEWQRWWDRVQEGYRLPSPAELAQRRARAEASASQYAPEKGQQFLEIPTRSRRMLFLLDISASMGNLLVPDSSNAREREEFVERFGRYQTKIELAREELIRTVASLEPHVRFDVVTFHTDVDRWKGQLVSATSGNKNSAIKFLSRFTPEYIESIAKSSDKAGRTNTFDALGEAFGLTRDVVTPSSRANIAESDTVFLVTDGMPTEGRITDPGEVLRYFRAVNARARIVFHTISFGHDNATLLGPIAELSGGKHLVIGDR